MKHISVGIQSATKHTMGLVSALVPDADLLLLRVKYERSWMGNTARAFPANLVKHSTDGHVSSMWTGDTLAANIGNINNELPSVSKHDIKALNVTNLHNKHDLPDNVLHAGQELAELLKCPERLPRSLD